MAETTASKTPRKSTAVREDAVSAAEAAAPKSTVDKVREQASALAGEATEAARNAANTGKEKAAEALDSVAKMADDAARAVDDQFGATYGDYARKASSTVADVASSLKSKDIDDLIADTTAFVRKSPVLAVGAAAAVGFLLTRLVKIGTGSDRA